MRVVKEAKECRNEILVLTLAGILSIINTCVLEHMY